MKIILFRIKLSYKIKQKYKKVTKMYEKISNITNS